MIRLLILLVVLFALPTVCYALWQVVVGWRRGEIETEQLEVEAMPWRWLGIAGAVCVVIGFAVLMSGEVTNPGKAYRPPPAATPGN